MIQETVVALIVAAAVWRLLLRYAPKKTRQALHRFTLALLRRVGLGALAERSARKSRSGGGGCGGCSGCASGGAGEGGGADQAGAGSGRAPGPVVGEARISAESLKRSLHR
jgi:uncharacterized membrane protein YgcG